MTARPHIPVVCAVIEDVSRRVLIAQRPPHKHLGGKWEFPGGKIEANESAPVALQREIREELGCELRILGPLPPFDHDYGDIVITMMPFLCALAVGTEPPHANEHTAIRWVNVDELKSIDLAPADWPVVRALAKRQA